MLSANGAPECTITIPIVNSFNSATVHTSNAYNDSPARPSSLPGALPHLMAVLDAELDCVSRLLGDQDQISKSDLNDILHLIRLSSDFRARLQGPSVEQTTTIPIVNSLNSAGENSSNAYYSSAMPSSLPTSGVPFLLEALDVELDSVSRLLEDQGQTSQSDLEDITHLITLSSDFRCRLQVLWLQNLAPRMTSMSSRKQSRHHPNS